MNYFKTYYGENCREEHLFFYDKNDKAFHCIICKNLLAQKTYKRKEK